ncbi:hypothetical protein AMST5_02072 [freshwater sediment metagenome]|uniref:Uncharacterized protein n=1 Tax=freshwater sediment metagenome TaxID=556182 RepID=A0AA48M233_9ZZZZ
MIAVPPTRRASRATLPARGRDGCPQSVACSEPLFLIRNADAAPSLPFTGRVAREARRVGSDPAIRKLG